MLMRNDIAFDFSYGLPKLGPAHAGGSSVPIRPRGGSPVAGLIPVRI